MPNSTMTDWGALPEGMRIGDLTFIQAVDLRNEMQQREERLTQHYTDGLVTEVEWARGCFLITYQISLLYHQMKKLAEQSEREMNRIKFEFEGLQVAMSENRSGYTGFESALLGLDDGI